VLASNLGARECFRSNGFTAAVHIANTCVASRCIAGVLCQIEFMYVKANERCKAHCQLRISVLPSVITNIDVVTAGRIYVNRLFLLIFYDNFPNKH
jgi:hypothetical protein